MNDLFNSYIKPLLIFLATIITSVISPIQNVLVVLFVSFLLNIFLGIGADVHANKTDFNIKKAFDAISQLLLYSTLLIFIHFITNSMHDMYLNGMGVKWVTYVVVYYYLANSLRNAKIIFPKSGAIKFLYNVLSTQGLSELKNFWHNGPRDDRNNELNNEQNDERIN